MLELGTTHKLLFLSLGDSVKIVPGIKYNRIVLRDVTIVAPRNYVLESGRVYECKTQDGGTKDEFQLLVLRRSADRSKYDLILDNGKLQTICICSV